MNPEWNETFDFPVPNKGAVLALKIWDKNKIQDDELIGTAEVPLNDLKNFEEAIRTVPITGRILKTLHI